MARTRQSPAPAPLDPFYVFSALTGFGFVTQWIVMMVNGSLVAMIVTTWEGAFPNGTPVKSWTGIWPIDFVLGVLVVFFGGVLDLADLPDLGPYLILVDLISALGVCGIMTLVEDRRNRKTGSLRYPAFWQIMWNYCGAASIMPVYSRLYVKNRLANSPGLPRDQAQALPFTALWSIVLSLTLLLPTVLGAAPFRIQDGVVVWFLSPLAVGPFQELASVLISRLGSYYKGFANPVAGAYCIVGAVSGAVHLSVAAWAFRSPDLSWSRIYWPNHAAVQPGPTHMTEAAVVFMQYGHLAVSFCVLALGIYTLRSAKVSAGRPMLTLVALTAIAGPGVGLAWLLCGRERETTAAVNASSKKS
ncbi:hypothetical protein F4677DRAFT_10258 [Hypoxylon crocopeplum]|nr:hypothetical protein F4677DRAFT_10258 [Hypoxylon crocopeplum]